MSPKVKFPLYGYLGVSVCCNAIYSYNNGIEGMTNYRNSITHNKKWNADEEWQMIKTHIGKHFWSRFYDSFTWPFSITSRIMPTMIMMMHPHKKN